MRTIPRALFFKIGCTLVFFLLMGQHLAAQRYVDVNVNGAISRIAYDASSQNITVTLASGKTQIITPTLNLATNEMMAVRITAANGERWIVDKRGNIGKAPSVQAPPPLAVPGTPLDFVVNFSPHDNQTGGLDIHDEFNYDQDHTQLLINGETYYVPWKSIGAETNDVVNATASNTQTFPPFVGFKNNYEITTTPLGSSKTLSVEGTLNIPVTAYARTQDGDREVGRLNVLVLDRINCYVHIVPVNNTPLLIASTIQAGLNQIYKQAQVRWTVTTEPNFNYEGDLSVFDEGNSGSSAQYNAQMRAFNSAYKKTNSNVDKNHYYIFLISGVHTANKGFMPLKRNFGYVYAEKTGDNVRAIAQELGHGAFNLKSTFEEFPSVTRGSTPNLMDHGTGTQLKKYQWLKIRERGRQRSFGILEAFKN